MQKYALSNGIYLLHSCFKKIHKGLNFNSVRFSWLMAAYYALVLNFPFILNAYIYTHHKESIFLSLLLSLLVCVFLWCIFISIFSLLSIKYIEKPIYIGLTLISSLLSYAYMYYNVQFDDFSPMIGVIEQTTVQQVFELLTPSFGLWFFFTGILPAYFISRVRLTHPIWWKEIGLKFICLLVYPLFFFLLVLPSLRTVQPLLRLSGLAARPPYQIVPNNFAENIFNHYKIRLTSHLTYAKIGLDAKILKQNQNTKPQLLVLVIGETARGMSFQLNGYKKPTNPYTIKQQIVSFRHVSSCGTATRVSVPCMFSNLPRRTFVDFVADNQDNLLDILTRVGMKSFWLENNDTGGCQGVCKNIETKKTELNDSSVITELKQQLQHTKNSDRVIVLHLSGSHGPEYFSKYPKEFAVFKPECRKNELRLCDKASLLNTYDNTILFTDYVLNELIEVLKQESASWNSALIYTSDHGESMGEHGMYGHCAPYLVAPREQTHVPLLVWLSPDFQQEKHVSLACLKEKALKDPFSHDNFFHSILGLMDVSTAVYQPQLDLFKSCRA